MDVKLRPETLEDYKSWALVLSESLQSDEQYKQAKMAPMRIQEEQKRQENEAIEKDAQKQGLLAAMINYRTKLNEVFCSAFMDI